MSRATWIIPFCFGIIGCIIVGLFIAWQVHPAIVAYWVLYSLAFFGWATVRKIKDSKRAR